MTTTLPARHLATDAHGRSARGITTSDRGPFPADAHDPGAPVGSDSAATDARSSSEPIGFTRPSLLDPSLYMLASLLDDIEGVRKSSANRVRILTTREPDDDGVMRGFGLDSSHPSVMVLEALTGQLDALEHGTILALNRAMRAHPLAPYQKQAKGVGEKQLARLLAATGDPYLRSLPDGSTVPRTVSQLWAYCGLHTLPTGRMTTDTHLLCAGGEREAAKRRKGQQANWSTDAKTRAYLIATSCIKQTGEYRDLYDERRAHTAVSHPDWTPGHSHNDALRIVSKRVLRDLWRAARDYHQPDIALEVQP